MRRFPNTLVNKLPIPIVAAHTVVWDVAHFYAEVSICIRPHRSDWQIGVGVLPFLKLRLLHPAAADRVAWAAQAFVRRHMSLRESRRQSQR